MLDSIKDILFAVWEQDLDILLSPESIVLIYILSAVIIGLEGAFLPAVALPNDSVVILIGTLTALGGLNVYIALPLLIVSAIASSWLAFIQGNLLSTLPKVQYWLEKVPEEKMKVVDYLLFKNGIFSLFIARFIPVIRILVPMSMGGRKVSFFYFNIYSLISAIMWASTLFSIGYVLPLFPENVNKTVTTSLLAISVLTFLTVILSALIWKVKRWLYSL
ncbi:DedA family protein [Vibrio crassostreae]|uniref:DedA family protein n=1 Tax=Vibrio crassostreae TaxID=246167 RepID=UPI002E19EAF9|nr:DedA family protein [Vibrio crassostreae]